MRNESTGAMRRGAKLARGLISAALYRIERLLLRVRVGLQSMAGIVGAYQPNPFSAPARVPDPRACQERFLAFAAVLPEGAVSCIDVGCNTGYFTFKIAERGGICLGLDIGRNEISYARGLAALHSVDNAAFLQHEITPDNVNALPQVDLIVCMSVFHHWVRKIGLAQATRIVDGLAARCRFLVFETGQHNEVDTDWARHLAFMGSDCDLWTRMFLAERGFASVRKLGEFSTTLSSVPRNLYFAQRAESV
jgi:SAM-dependent methyltransferase